MKKILKASAGTGKTYRLSLEYLSALMRGQDFEEIVVMTFTRKATAEIRERVFAHLKDILAKGEDSSILKSLREIYPDIEYEAGDLENIYQKMIRNKDRVRIYTIDSFINRIFKQAVAPYLGVYSYQIIDENSNEGILEELFRYILESPADFALMEKFLKDNTERYITHYLDLIREIINNRWKFLLINYRERSRMETGNLSSCLDRCQDILEKIALEKGDGFSPEYYVKDFQNFMSEYCTLQSEEEKKDKIYRNYGLFFNRSFWNGRKISGKKTAELREELEAEFEHFLQELAACIYIEEMIPYEEEIFKFSSRIFEIYDKLKFREKAFTHTDISNYVYKYFNEPALGLIDEGKATRYFYELLENQVKSLYIDEFQDTSILQWKILKPLIDRCDNVIIVGDEKQSIYGWRGGEKELFSNLHMILEAGIETLNTCYRSDKEIVDFINRFFLNIEMDWEYSVVEHLSDKTGGYLELLLGGEKTRTNTETRSFAGLSQEKQQEILEMNEKITADLKRGIALRLRELPSYNNTAVLARSNRELNEIAFELDREGIPYLLESKDSILDHQAVKPLYLLLRYLNYRDYFDLLKFLRSDIIGINNTVLRYLLANKAEVEGLMAGEEKQLDYPDLQDFLLEVRQLGRLDYKELTNYLFEHSGLLEKYGDNNGFLKNITFFFQLMRRFNSLAELMLYLEENRDSDELKQPAVREDNAVQLMTIHKAKGLSFETEFFYWNLSGNRGNSFAGMELYLEFDEDFQEVTDYLLTNSRYEKLFEYLGFDFAERKKEKELVEEINNLYVALTRPEKNLFIYIEGPRKLEADNDGRCWSGSSYEFYEGSLLHGAGADTLYDLIERKEIGLLRTAGEKEEVNLPVLSDLSEFFRPFKISEELLREAVFRKDFDMTVEKEIRRLEGLALHYYLEYIRYNTERERDYARKMVLGRYGNILGPARIDKIIKRVEDFLDEYRGYFQAGWQAFTEYELEDEGKVYRIDHLRVNEEKKEILVLDYKSGITKEQAQLDKYREIIERKTGGKYRVRTEFLEI